MLEVIVGSLRGYPDCGGDIQVMTEVERIVAEALTDHERVYIATPEEIAETEHLNLEDNHEVEN